MNITISKREIFDEVEKRTSLEGTAIPERFEGVWASRDEGKFLDSFWVESYTASIQLFKRYLASDTINHTLNSYNEDEVFCITADMPSRYNNLLDGSIETSLKMMIVCNIIHGWLKIKQPDIASKYDEEGNGFAEDIRVKLLYRANPASNTIRVRRDYMQVYPRHEFINPAKKDNIRLPEQWGKCNNKETKKELKDYSCPCI